MPPIPNPRWDEAIFCIFITSIPKVESIWSGTIFGHRPQSSGGCTDRAVARVGEGEIPFIQPQAPCCHHRQHYEGRGGLRGGGRWQWSIHTAPGPLRLLCLSWGGRDVMRVYIRERFTRVLRSNILKDTAFWNKKSFGRLALHWVSKQDSNCDENEEGTWKKGSKRRKKKKLQHQIFSSQTNMYLSHNLTCRRRCSCRIGECWVIFTAHGRLAAGGKK